MDKLAFITTIAPGKSLMDLHLLLASIRDFGGELADAPIWVCIPQKPTDIPDQVRDYLTVLDVNFLSFQADDRVQSYPFGARVQAAYEVEKALTGKTELLAWLDGDTIILQEPTELLLPAGKVLGYRPVHHRLLGTRYGEELDCFWELMYRKCGASFDPSRFMVTHTGQLIHPYFNAGSFVVRPEEALLENWWLVFLDLYQSSDFLPFYDRDKRYPVFMHQMIFTGILLAATEDHQRQEFSHRINYPLHLHQEVSEDLRAESINNLVTVRYESIFDESEWQDQLPIHEPLLSWLHNQLELKKDIL